MKKFWYKYFINIQCLNNSQGSVCKRLTNNGINIISNKYKNNVVKIFRRSLSQLFNWFLPSVTVQTPNALSPRGCCWTNTSSWDTARRKQREGQRWSPAARRRPLLKTRWWILTVWNIIYYTSVLLLVLSDLLHCNTDALHTEESRNKTFYEQMLLFMFQPHLLLG